MPSTDYERDSRAWTQEALARAPLAVLSVASPEELALEELAEVMDALGPQHRLETQPRLERMIEQPLALACLLSRRGASARSKAGHRTRSASAPGRPSGLQRGIAFRLSDLDRHARRQHEDRAVQSPPRSCPRASTQPMDGDFAPDHRGTAEFLPSVHVASRGSACLRSLSCPQFLRRRSIAAIGS